MHIVCFVDLFCIIYCTIKVDFYHCKVLILQWDKNSRSIKETDPLDTGRKLNVHKTFRIRPGRLLNVLGTFNLRPVCPRWGEKHLAAD